MAKQTWNWNILVTLLHFVIIGGISVSGFSLPKDYDRALRPNNDAVADYIKVNVQVSSIRDVNQGDLTIDLIIKSQWTDSRLTGLVSNREQIFSNELPQIWLPDLYAINAVSAQNPERHSSSLKISSDGSINYLERLAIKLNCEMTFKKFPFDKQSCPLTLQSLAYTRIHMDLIWHGTVNEDVTVYDTEYSLSSMDQSNRNLRTKEGEYSQLTLTFYLNRSGVRLLFRAILPAFVFAALSYATFFFETRCSKSAVQSSKKLLVNFTRLAINSLSIIVMTMISQTSALGSPTSATVTAVDVWISISFIIILIAFIVSVIRIIQTLNQDTNNPVTSQSESQTELSSQKPRSGKSILEKIEKYFRISLPIIFLIFSIIYFAVYLS